MSEYSPTYMDREALAEYPEDALAAAQEVARLQWKDRADKMEDFNRIYEGKFVLNFYSIQDEKNQSDVVLHDERDDEDMMSPLPSVRFDEKGNVKSTETQIEAS